LISDESFADVAECVTEVAYASLVNETLVSIETVAKSKKKNTFVDIFERTKLFNLVLDIEK
jgi:hypothetical protein